MFFLYAGGSPPDANEAHYLAKAKHYWNPSWCSGDFFLESADAHQVFCWTFGWLTLWLSLPAVAWIGRVITWGLLAWSWRRLNFALVPKPLFALVSAALFLSFIGRCQMAGEWVVGGVEAKGVAYSLVFLGLEAIARNQWRRVWLLLGAAASFHVLVGGWSVVAAGVALMAAGKSRPGTQPATEPPSLFTQLPYLAVGMLLALPGLLPALALTSGVERETIGQANEIYVFERLSHHLVPHRFAPIKIAAHGTLLIVWLGLAYAVRRDEAQRRIQSFVLGAVLIAAAGVLIDVVLWTQPRVAALVLRYYWFRLSDAAVPLGAALALLALAGSALLADRHPGRSLQQWLMAACIIVATVNLGSEFYVKRFDTRPGADIQSLSQGHEDTERTREIYHDWLRTCHWIGQNTPADAVFLTPRRQQTFKWYAGRGEVFCWKDVPQDAQALVEWKRRRDRIFPSAPRDEGDANEIPEVVEHDLLQHSDKALTEICRDYGARYLVVDRTHSARRPRFVRVYPTPRDDFRAFEVYDLGGK